MANDDDNTDTLIGVGAAGGGALLLWWLLRGRRFGAGREAQEAPSTAPPSAAPVPAGPPCRVFLRGKAIDLNGAAADLPATVAACRAAGAAHLRASGDTTTSAVMTVARALNAADVAIVAHADIADTVRDAITRVA